MIKYTTKTNTKTSLIQNETFFTRVTKHFNVGGSNIRQSSVFDYENAVGNLCNSIFLCYEAAAGKLLPWSFILTSLLCIPQEKVFYYKFTEAFKVDIGPYMNGS